MNHALLIIDDDDVFLHLHEQLLLKHGLINSPMKFETCSQAFDYIQQIKDSDTKFFILLDIYMDGMSGWDFMDQLYAHNLQDLTRVVIVTSSISLHDHKKSKEYPNIQSYIEKPFTNEHLKQLLEETDLKDFL